MTRTAPATALTTFKCDGCGQRFPASHVHHWETAMTVCSADCQRVAWRQFCAARQREQAAAWTRMLVAESQDR
jgi:hypothetical protein